MSRRCRVRKPAVQERRPKATKTTPVFDMPPSSVIDLLKQIKVVSDEEAEQADMVVCCTNDSPSYFLDDVYTICADCGAGIHHRPHVPKRPKKVCIDCALKHAEREKEEKERESSGDDLSA